MKTTRYNKPETIVITLHYQERLLVSGSTTEDKEHNEHVVPSGGEGGGDEGDDGYVDIDAKAFLWDDECGEW